MGKKIIGNEMVQPDQVVGEKGEFEPGDGVRIKNYKLVATQAGRLVLDEKTKVISVVPAVGGG